MSAIELKDVSKSYGARRAIDSVPLAWNAASGLPCSGRPGAGSRRCCTSLPASSLRNEAKFEGELVASARKTLREPEERGIGMVFQDLALWPDGCGEYRIRSAGSGVSAAERNQRVKSMVELVGLGDYLRAKPGREQQRVALARTLALSPRIVLMDDPLSSLDKALNAQLRMEILRGRRRVLTALSQSRSSKINSIAAAGCASGLQFPQA
jgi:ABC-type sugar transport system ATPase subunit